MSLFRKFGVSLILFFTAGSPHHFSAHATNCTDAISRLLMQSQKMPVVRTALREITDAHLPSLEMVLSEPPHPRQSENTDVVRIADLALSPHLLVMVEARYKYPDPLQVVQPFFWNPNHPQNNRPTAVDGLPLFSKGVPTPHEHYRSFFARGFEWQSTLDPNLTVYTMRVQLAESNREVLLEIHPEISKKRVVNEHGNNLGKYYSVLNSLSIRLIEPNGEPLPGNLIEGRLKLTKILLARLFGLREDRVGIRNDLLADGYAHHFGGTSIVQTWKPSETHPFYMPLEISRWGSAQGTPPGIVNSITRGTRYSDAFIATFIDIMSMPQAQYLSLYSQLAL